jgi:hypothetical protein
MVMMMMMMKWARETQVAGAGCWLLVRVDDEKADVPARPSARGDLSIITCIIIGKQPSESSNPFFTVDARDGGGSGNSHGKKKLNLPMRI